MTALTGTTPSSRGLALPDGLTELFARIKPDFDPPLRRLVRSGRLGVGSFSAGQAVGTGTFRGAVW